MIKIPHLLSSELSIKWPALSPKPWQKNLQEGLLISIFSYNMLMIKYLLNYIYIIMPALKDQHF